MSKDNQRTPPRGPAGDRTYNSANPERGQRDDRYADDREPSYGRSRSPRREGRGRYTDRDREGYQSPRNRSRSHSPNFGAPPNRTVILEGLSVDMTQEDVGRPLLTPLRI
jgi:RNA-binding protein 5/10